jgi:hypothetical protein
VEAVTRACGAVPNLFAGLMNNKSKKRKNMLN